MLLEEKKGLIIYMIKKRNPLYFTMYWNSRYFFLYVNNEIYTKNK